MANHNTQISLSLSPSFPLSLSLSLSLSPLLPPDAGLAPWLLLNNLVIALCVATAEAFRLFSFIWYVWERNINRPFCVALPGESR